MDLHLFRPAVDSKGLLYTNGTDILGHLAFSFGLLVDGGFGILPFNGFVNDTATPAAEADYCNGRGDLLCGRLVDAMFTGTLHANLGLFNILVVGIQFPVAVFATGPNVSVPGFFNDVQGVAGSTPRSLDYQGVGPLSMHVKARILRAERTGGFGLAALLQAEFPVGSPAEFVSDNSVVLWPILAGEWRPHRLFRIGVKQTASLKVESAPVEPAKLDQFLDANGATWGARRDVIDRAKFNLAQSLEVILDSCDPQGPVDVAASFDEFNLDLRVSYVGPPIELPVHRPTNEEIMESEEGQRRLAGFMLRRFADRVSAANRNGRSTVLFHFDH